MDLTVVELGVSPETRPDTALGALAGLAFLVAVTAVARWTADRHNP